MKISKLLVASAIALAGTASAGLIWSPDTHGSVGSGQILQLDGTTDGGWWYSYNDSSNGGASTVSWGNGSGEFSDKIDLNGMIDVTFNNGAGYAYPFTGIGFNWISDDAGGEGPYTVSAVTGYCATYAGTGATVLEMKWDGLTYGYSTYQVTMAKTTGSVTKDMLFSTFKRPYAEKDYPAGASIALAQAQTLTSGVQFGFKGAAGTTEELKLYAFGTAGSCGPAATQFVGKVAGLKASLSGSSLAFAGLGKKTAKVEIINLQGQVVASKTITSAMNTVDLSKAAHGVYVVKAFGKDLSFSKMITLK